MATVRPMIICPHSPTGERNMRRANNLGFVVDEYEASRRGRPVLAPWQIHVVEDALGGNCPNTIAMSDIAIRCRISLSYFVRAFTNTVGLPPYAWFLLRRIERSKDMLRSSSLSVAQIALECGFADQSCFTKAFTRAVGTPPARWRRSRKDS